MTREERDELAIQIANTNLDPRLSPSNSSASSADREGSTWLEHCRVLETLRTIIQRRLDNHYYYGDDGLFTEAMRPQLELVSPSKGADSGSSSQGLYPDLGAARR